jgi:3-isopropylmalate dehydrogenase
MFGDIVSDAFAGLIGGLGFACSASFQRKGSEYSNLLTVQAPKYADYETSIVNPVAMIRVCMHDA